ncbi:MAG: branched-chain amino acid ABC transporter permease [Bacillati bacterium ANGP1]|uniref:Branched-chain amino acid ABC transporter permease n=1 Tax=Candidatus Segetimicrobium genomatis TaxID=2569760 RepID=A0A537JWB7_9BACT|nr:MAG: branched-chain amino acid ABC transporter permease [Terrabacteria group bacterium ANGP1]
MTASLSIFLQLLTNGVVVGMVYALAALGFVLIYKASRVINLAQGYFVALGAFGALAIAQVTHLPFVLAVAASLAGAFLLGLLVERLLLRPMIGERPIAVIMVTIGLAAVLRGGILLVWGAGNFGFPQLLPESPLVLGPLIVSPVHLGALAISLAFLAVFVVFFRRTTLGVAMRAVADDQQAAQSLGVSVRRVFAASWAIAATVAAVGGVVVGSLNGLNADALSFIGLKVFPAVILGGLDSVPGAVVGGVTVGVLENLAGGYIDPLVGGGAKEVAPFVVLVLALMVRPYGLFGTVEIERV